MGLSEKQLKAIEVLSEPQNKTKSWKAKAELVGVTEKTLKTWRESDEFLKAMEEDSRKNLRSKRPVIDAKLLELAEQGDLKAMRLYYELTGAVYEGKDKPITFQPIQINIHQLGSVTAQEAIQTTVEYLE